MTIDPLTVLLAAVPLYYLSIFLHETGHAVMGWLMGYQVTSFGLGLGRPWWVVTWRGIRTYFCPRRSTMGITWAIQPEIHPSRWRQVGFMAGGLLANGLVALAALALWRLLPGAGGVWLAALGCSGWLWLNSLVPVTVRLGKIRLQTDGAVILQVLWRGSVSRPAPDILRALASGRGHWEAVGDTRILYVHLLSAAAVWADLGDGEQAELLLREAEGLPGDHTPFTQSLIALVWAAVDGQTGRFEPSAAALAEAEKGFQSSGDESGLFLVSLQRVEWLLQQGDAPSARASLEALRHHPVLARHGELRAVLLVTGLRVCAALPGGEGVEQMRVEYELTRLQYPSPSRDLHAYRALAGFHARQEDWAQAEPFYKKVLVAARQLYEELPGPEDRSRFQRCQAGLLGEAETSLRRAGKDGEVERLRLVFPSPEELARERRLAREQRNRRYFRAGLLLALVNIPCGLLLVALFVLWPNPTQAYGPEKILGTVGLLLISSSVVVFLFSLLLLTIWWLLPGLRASGGGISLWLAVLPWLSWILPLGIWIGKSSMP